MPPQSSHHRCMHLIKTNLSELPNPHLRIMRRRNLVDIHEATHLQDQAVSLRDMVHQGFIPKINPAMRLLRPILDLNIRIDHNHVRLMTIARIPAREIIGIIVRRDLLDRPLRIHIDENTLQTLAT